MRPFNRIGRPLAVNRAASAGFTLMELLISLTILSVIVVLITGALRVGIRAWEKGEASVYARQHRRIVLDLMKRQIRSICLRNIVNNASQPFVLVGTSTELQLVSYLPLAPQHEALLVYACYRVQRADKDRLDLVFYESDVGILDDQGKPEPIDDELFYVLIEDVGDFVFEYLKPEDSGVEAPESQPEAQWVQEWVPEDEDNRFPKAVRMTYQADSAEAPVIVVAILPESDQSATTRKIN